MPNTFWLKDLHLHALCFSISTAPFFHSIIRLYLAWFSTIRHSFSGTGLFGTHNFFPAFHCTFTHGAMDPGVVRQVDVRTLITSLFLIVSELLRRFRVPLHIDYTIDPLDVEQPPPAPARPAPAPAFQQCDQGCRFCDLPCHRHKFGHSHHSCYQHRHWRD